KRIVTASRPISFTRFRLPTQPPQKQNARPSTKGTGAWLARYHPCSPGMPGALCCHHHGKVVITETKPARLSSLRVQPAAQEGFSAPHPDLARTLPGSLTGTQGRTRFRQRFCACREHTIQPEAG